MPNLYKNIFKNIKQTLKIFVISNINNMGSFFILISFFLVILFIIFFQLRENYQKDKRYWESGKSNIKILSLHLEASFICFCDISVTRK